jgi:hypothetical protein
MRNAILRRAAGCFMAVVLTAGFTGCASVSVTGERTQSALAPEVKPTLLYLRPFTRAPGADFDVTAPADGPSADQRIAESITTGVMSRSEKWVAPTTVLRRGDPAPAGGLLIDGEVTRARQGSRALRLILGFGAGRSRLDTSVRVYNLDKSATKPWLVFRTTGGSNVEPGLVAAVVPGPMTLPAVAAMAGGVASTMSRGLMGISNDGKRSGRAIAAAVHDQLVQEELVKRRARVKRSGKIVTPAGEVPVPNPLARGGES